MSITDYSRKYSNRQTRIAKTQEKAARRPCTSTFISPTPLHRIA